MWDRCKPNPCLANCMTMCPMKMYSKMQKMQLQMPKCSMMQYPMIDNMMKFSGLQPIMNPMVRCPMMQPMMNSLMNPTMGQNIGCMIDTMRSYQDIEEDEEEVPYVTMKEVKIEDIQE